MPDFDANFLPVLAIIALVLAVEAALAVACAWGAWMVASTLLAALDVARSPGELALALAACAALVVGVGYCGWLAYGGSRKDG